MASDELRNIFHKFDLAKDKVKESARVGLGKAGGQLLADAILKKPTVPYLEGELRGSGSVAVSGRSIHTSEDFGYPNGDPETTGAGSKEKRNEIIAIVGFNKPYATKWHFHEPDGGFSEPSAGKNYLFGKMAIYNRSYWGMVAREIREAL